MCIFWETTPPLSAQWSVSPVTTVVGRAPVSTAISRLEGWDPWVGVKSATAARTRSVRYVTRPPRPSKGSRARYRRAARLPCGGEDPCALQLAHPRVLRGPALVTRVFWDMGRRVLPLTIVANVKASCELPQPRPSGSSGGPRTHPATLERVLLSYIGISSERSARLIS